MRRFVFIMMLLVLVFSLTACESWTNSVKKTVKGVGGKYTVHIVGCEGIIMSYHPDGYVNSEKETDGWYFYVDGKLVRVSGDVIIEERG